MTRRQDLQIITIYAQGQSKGARSRFRALSLLSLLVAAVWLFQFCPRKIPATDVRLHSITTADHWIVGKFLLSSFVQSSDMMAGAQQNPWVALGLAPPPPESAKPDPATQQEIARKYTRHMSVLWATYYIWKVIAVVAGGWLLLAAVVGLAGWRQSRRLHKQSACLMLVSTVVTVAGIFVAIRWGGMPEINDPTLYAKIAAVQSAYAWVLLVATRVMR